MASRIIGVFYFPPAFSQPWLYSSSSVRHSHSSFMCSQNNPIPSLVLYGANKQHKLLISDSQSVLGSPGVWSNPDITVLPFARLVSGDPQLDKQYKADDVFCKNSTNLAATMLTLAENGCVEDAESIWDLLLNSSLVPTFHLVSSLVIAYAKTSNFDQISRILTQLRNRKFSWLPRVYSLSISCFGIGGKLELMEQTMNEMVSMGLQVDSLTGNAFVFHYSKYGSLAEMEVAYGRLKKSRILIEEEAIRAVCLSYMKGKKFYKLGEFVRDVGLGRKNVGNLLWNILLLSYAVNFKMKSLQREFLGMVKTGFRPDLTSFNIRALAFSRMNLFWDLHISIEHMRHENVVPDLVTYGCVIDAYMEKRMVNNLDFVLKNMVNLDEFPSVGTDPFVFEAMGKGDFHLASEAFMEFNKHRRWTYRKLIQIYVKKQHRRTQIFWNY